MQDKWLVKTLFQEGSYDILVTDLACVWAESLGSEEVARRSKVSVHVVLSLEFWS